MLGKCVVTLWVRRQIRRVQPLHLPLDGSREPGMLARIHSLGSEDRGGEGGAVGWWRFDEFRPGRLRETEAITCAELLEKPLNSLWPRYSHGLPMYASRPRSAAGASYNAPRKRRAPERDRRLQRVVMPLARLASCYSRVSRRSYSACEPIQNQIHTSPPRTASARYPSPTRAEKIGCEGCTRLKRRPGCSGSRANV